MLTKFWKGEYPLPLMFWVFFLAIPVVLRLILLISGFVSLADAQNTAAHSAGMIALLGLFMLVYYVIAFIATWRSASRYSKANGGMFGRKGIDWGLIAKLAMIVIFVTQGFTLI